MKKKLTSIKVKNKDIQKDKFLEFLSEKNKRNRTEEQAFLININYIYDINMTQCYFKLLKEDKISVDQKEQVKGLKLLLSEFLYLCGHDDALEIQMNLLNQNNETHNELSEQDKKVFDNIELKYDNGDIEKVIIFYGEKRGCTTWYIKNDKKYIERL